MKVLNILLQHKILISAFLILCILLSYIYYEDYCIDLEPFTISIKNLPSEFIGLKIAHISDVHLPVSSSYINNIIDSVKNENPDLIFLTGDIVDRRANLKTCGLDDFCRKLADICPTYAVLGNNDYGTNNLTLWENIITENGVIVLNNETDTYVKNNKSLAILGLSDKYDAVNTTAKIDDQIEDIPVLLLSHRPEKFYNYYHSPNIIKPDLVFTGHAHGGQIRLPFINLGLFAPGQGLFPKYTSGLYTNEEDEKIIVSRGLCNSSFPIRINNRIHLPIITLTN